MASNERRWYCESCYCMCDPREVTYDERHDDRFGRGGCGRKVVDLDMRGQPPAGAAPGAPTEDEETVDYWLAEIERGEGPTTASDREAFYGAVARLRAHGKERGE